METNQETPAVQEVVTSQPISTADIEASRAGLKQMLSNARNTTQMLQDFLSAIRGCNVSGEVVYKLAIGIQFLETLLSQSKADIQRLQAAMESK